VKLKYLCLGVFVFYISFSIFWFFLKKGDSNMKKLIFRLAIIAGSVAFAVVNFGYVYIRLF